MTMRASLIITARDGVSPVWSRIRNASRQLVRSIRDIGTEGQKAGRQIDRIGVNAPSRFARIGAAARRAGNFGLKVLEKSAYGAGYGMGFLIRKGSQWALEAAKWGALAAGAGAGAFLGGVISQASKFEQFQVVLENTEGSAAKARKAMDWVKDFAKTTPYEVAEVMEAFVALKAYGLDPMDGTLKALGNTASGMSKSLSQAVEMIADAQTGEFERLKEFGIRAKVAGDQVTFTYMKAGREIKKTARNSAADIQKSLIGILDQRFAGMMDRQSKTLAGTWSNIKDMFSGFQLDIADAGIFDLIKQKAERALAVLQGWAKDGTLKAWAVRISDGFQNAFLWAQRLVTETNWSAVGRDIATLAGFVRDFAGALIAAVTWAQRLANALNSIQNFGGTLNRYLNMPAGWLNSIQNSGSAVNKWFNGGSPASTAPRNMKQLPGPNPWGVNPVRKGPASQTKVGGGIDVRIFTDPNVKARVSSLKTDNPDVPLRASRGPVSFG